MTKLEEKLIELGYKGYYNSLTHEHHRYYKQKQIDSLQQAFNQLQNDLKDLKECDE